MARRRRRTKEEIERDEIDRQFLKQTFDARPYPEVIWVGDEAFVGPFCFHCGNPYLFHGPDRRCPNRVLHPLFPQPNLPVKQQGTP